MKRKLLLTLLIILVCATAALCSACNDDDGFSSFALKKDTVYVKIGGKLTLENCFETVGKGKIFYSIDNPDAMSVDDGVLLGKAEGEGYVFATSGRFEAKLKVIVYDPYKVAIRASDATYDYDGEIKNITLSGTLPEGATVRYYCGDDEFFGSSLPGKYVIRVTVDLPDGYRLVEFSDTAILTINRKELALDVTLDGATYDYDGKEKTLRLNGDLPDGVTVQYSIFCNGEEKASAVDAGKYIVKASFFVDETYYEPIRPISALLTINKRAYDIDLTHFDRQTYTYDAEEKFFPVSLSEGLRADYYVYDDAQKKFIKKEEYAEKYAKNKPFTDSGTLRMKVVFSALQGYEGNYDVPEQREYTLRINKADFYSDIAWRNGTSADYDSVYDGEAKTIGYGESFDFGLIGSTHGVKEEYPEGAEIKFCIGSDKRYDSLSATDAGTYLITAKFIMPDGSEKNYNALPELTYAYIVKKGAYLCGVIFDGRDENGIVYKDKSIEYDGKSHTFGLSLSDQSEEEKFFRDITVQYYIEDKPATPTVRNAGSYVISYKLSFREPENGNSDDEKYIAGLKKNYTLPADGDFCTTISAKKVDISEASFADKTLTYDGQEHGIEIVGLDEISVFGKSVEVSYGKNNYINAGVYEIEATLSVAGDYASNYVFVKNGKSVASLTATLTIDKATYFSAPEPTPSVDGGVYSHEKTLSDYILPDGYRWQDETIVPTCSIKEYRAYYNADRNNYYDLPLYVSLDITPQIIDISLLTISSRFLPYTGKAVMPYVEGSSVAFAIGDLITDDGSEETPEAIGKHTYTNIKIQLADENNYRLVGEKDFGDIDIYVYDPGLYLYDGMRLVSYCGMESNVVVPEGTEYIRDGAFAGKSYIRSVSLPSSLVELSAGALKNTEGLDSVSLPFVGKSAASYGKLTDVFGGTLPDSLVSVTITAMTIIPNGAFKNCSGLKIIEFTDEVTEIGAEAFYDCSSLVSATFAHAATVGRYAFYGCKSMQKLVLAYAPDDETPAEYLFGANSGNNAYNSYSLELLDLSNGTFLTVPSYAFAGLSSLTELRLPETVTSYGYGSFNKVQAKILFGASFTEVTTGMFFGYAGASVDLPEAVTRIGKDAFKNAVYLTEITLPSGTNDIDEGAFYGVKATIVFDGDEYTTIKNKAFYGYAGRTLDIPSSVVTIESYAFMNSKLRQITIPSTVLNFGNNVFDGSELQQCEFCLKTLPSATFNNCSSLNSVTLSGVEIVGNNAFYGCSSLPSISIPGTVTRIGNKAFYGCDSLRTIVFSGESVPAFGENVFSSNVKISAYVSATLQTAFSDAITVYYPNVTIFAKEEA